MRITLPFYTVSWSGIISCFFLASSSSSVWCQQQTSWKMISDQDSRMKSGEIVWKGVVTRFPQTGVDLRKVKKNIAEQVQQKNLPPEAAKQWEVAMLQVAQSQVAGSKQGFSKTFVFERPRVMGEVVWNKNYNLQGAPLSGFSAGRDVDYLDGANVVAMRGGTKSETDYPQRGVVSRTQSTRLQYTASRFGDTQFLFGAPLSQIIKESDLVETTPEQVVFRLKAPKGSGWEGLPVSVSVSRQFWRPTLLELRTYSGELVFQQKATDWKQYQDGIWFPQKITATSMVQNGKVASREELQLVEASWNASADLSQLRPEVVVPKGTVLDDFRFNPRRTVRYRVRKQLPPDESVLRMVEEKEKKDVQGQRQQQLTVARNYALPAGLLLFIGGLFWFRRTRHIKA